MYSRRQRSTRNAAVATNASANTNARTTRGRTNKAKHPRRGGGNPDTARVRASIERPPVVPWIKVMRPPALHLRRTFLVEKWVRPSDLTEAEREVYDAEQKEKEEERQRMLKWQQQKREQEAREKEREEQEHREQKEKERAELAAATTAANQGGETDKTVETKAEQSKDNSATASVSATPAVVVPTTAAASNDAIAAKTGAETSEAATTVAPMKVESAQARCPSVEVEGVPTPAPTPTPPATMDSGQAPSEQVQTSLTETKPTAPLATEKETTLPAITDPIAQDHKQALPQKTEEESKEVPPASTGPISDERKEPLPRETEVESKEVPQVDSTTPVVPPETKLTAAETEPPKPSNIEDTSLSSERLAKKPRVE